MVLEEPLEPRFNEQQNGNPISTPNGMNGFTSSPAQSTTSFQVQFESSTEGFTLTQNSHNRQTVHNIPWRNCTPNPSLVRSRFSDMQKPATRLAVRDLCSTMATFQEGAQRPLTDDEVSAFAFYSAKKLQTVSYYWKGAAIMGTLIWWRARRTFKYPFLTTPKDLSGFDVFPHKSMPVFTGKTANRAWYAQRLGVYLGIAVPFGYFLGVSSGTMSQVIGIKTDTRTQGLVQQTQQNMRDRIAQGHPVAGRRGQIGPQGPQSPQRDRVPPSQPLESESDNDYLSMSLTSDTNRISTDTGLLNDAQMRARDRRQQSLTSYPDNATTQSSFDLNKVQIRDPYAEQNTRDRYSSSFSSQDFSGRNDRDRYSNFGDSSPSSSPSSFDWDDSTSDDASPTAGNERDPYLSSSNTSTSEGVSTWDRLRNESLTRQRGGSQPPQSQPQQQSRRPSYPPPPSRWPNQQQQQQQPQRPEESRPADSFNFSSADEDKSLVKQQAQKEFDDMVERERRGEGDENGGGGGRGLWGR